MTQESPQPTPDPRLMPSPRRSFKDLGEGTLRRIDWQELFPCLLLFRAFRVACSPRALLLALLGVSATALLLQWIGSNQVMLLPLSAHSNLVIFELNTDTFFLATTPWRVNIEMWLSWWFETGSWGLILGLFCIWGIIGGAIARIAVVRVGCVGNTSLAAVVRFLARRLKSFYAAVLLIVAGVMLGDAAIRLAIWCLGVPVLGQITAIGFFIPLTIAIMMTLLALPLVFGITLLLSAVVADGADMFDAVSRTMSYFYQRIWLYALYTLAAIGLGSVGFAMMSLITETAVSLLIRTGFPLGRTFASELGISFWMDVLRCVPLAFLIAFFWTSGVTIYLLLRRSLDGTTFDTVVEANADKPTTL